MNDVKWGTPHLTPLVGEYHEHVRQLVSRRAQELGGSWAELVSERTLELVNAEDLAALEHSKLDSGYRFEAAATVSVSESPEKYKPLQAAVDAAPEAADGRRPSSGEPVEVAEGDNVRQTEDVEGTLLRVRSTEQVFDLLADGVPENSIALIDDSGGTLTAPILHDFAALLCLGGTVRSHLAILSREYGIPCLMNVAVTGELETGDRVRVEYGAPTTTAASYEAGDAVRARVWNLG